MPANGSTIFFCRSIVATAFLLLSGLLCRCQSIPDLRRYQSRDDLTGWLYAEIQWVARSAASRCGELEKAVTEAWRSPRTEEEIQAWQDLLANEGYAFLLSGDIVRSTDAYTSAYEWALRHQELADETVVLENILKPLGNNYTRLGDYEQALFIHQQGLSLALSGKDKDALAGTYSNLANAYSNMGQPLKSLEYCRKGLAILNGHSALCGLLLSEQADASLQLQKFEAAQASIDKSIVLLEGAFARNNDAATGYWLLTAYQQAGDIYALAPKRSLGWYQRALVLQARLLQEHGDIRQRERAKLYYRLSALYARINEIAKAEYWSNQCLAVIVPGKRVAELKEDDLYAENTLADLLYTWANLSKASNDADEAIRLYGLCFVVEKKLRKELISSSSKQMAIADIRSRYEQAISIAWDNWDSTRNKKYEQAILSFMESSKSQLLLDELLRQRQLGNSHPGDSIEARIHLLENALVFYQREALQYRQSDSMAVVYQGKEKQLTWELAQLYKKAGGYHPVNTAIADKYAGFPTVSFPVIFDKGQAGRLFFAGVKALYTIECTSDGIRFAEKLPLGEQWEDSLRIFTKTWFGQGPNAMIDHPGIYYRQAYVLYRRLFGSHPFEDGIQYILFPDGALDLLPVEALVTDADCPASPAQWPFLIRRTLVSYGWSLQTLLQQRANSGAVLSFAGFFLSGNLRSSPLLGAVGEEEKGIRRIIGGNGWYTDTEATTVKFRRALETSSIVHISSHAFAKKDSFDVPHIELYDRPFYLFELQGMECHPALVVLSACKTGDGKMLTGEGVQSMARAFCAGGAHAVIGGWWNVNDETAARLMEAFYRQLAEEGKHNKANAAAALRKAKLEWLNESATPYLQKLPYFWSALGYLGDPTPVEKGALRPGPPTQKDGRWWWMLVLLPVIILFTIWAYVRDRR